MGDILDDIKPAPVGNDDRDPPFPEAVAEYRLALESVRFLDGTGQTRTRAFIPLFRVLTSSIPEVQPEAFHCKYFSMAGTEFPNAIETQMKEIMTFLCALSGFDPDTAEGKAGFSKAHPDQRALVRAVAAGGMNERELLLRTTLKKKGARAKTPGMWTVHSWSPAEGAPAPAAATPPAPRPAGPTPCPADWKRDETGTYAWSGTAWHVAATGAVA